MAGKKPSAKDRVSDATGLLFSPDTAPAPPELIADLLIKPAKKARKAALPADVKPHYLQHRERLRGRFQNLGGDTLADYELLELILFRIIPRQDTKPLAKALLDRFGDFAAVLGAESARIAEVPAPDLRWRWS